MPINTPPQITVPFATSGLKNAIPAASNNTTGNAGYNQGFPASNMTPRTAGGIPPFGQDVNGILFDITTALQYQQAGGLFPFSASFATSVGGYPIGAVILNAAKTGLWQNQVANNSTDPDAGGAGWANPLSGRLIGAQVFTANGNYTPTIGTKSIVVEVQAGGGGGGGANASTSFATIAGGGGAGGYAKSRITSGITTTALTVGVAGTRGAFGLQGGTGGASTFGAISTSGGAGGTVAAGTGGSVAAAGGGGGGGASGGNVCNIQGGRGSPGYLIGASSGNAGNGGITNMSFGAGGAALGAGGDAAGFGGGGGGALSSNNGTGYLGGQGAAGVIIIWEYA